MIATFDLFVKKPCFWQRKPVFICFIVSHLSGTYADDWKTTTSQQGSAGWRLVLRVKVNIFLRTRRVLFVFVDVFVCVQRF